jgi:hypothetical protein
MYVCMYVCKYVCLFVCTQVCMYVCTHIFAQCILNRSLQTETARECDVRRVHALRHALELLDVEDDSFSSIKEFVLLSYRSPHYLKVRL